MEDTVLRDGLIRLAYAKPTMQPYLLPILRQGTQMASHLSPVVMRVRSLLDDMVEDMGLQVEAAGAANREARATFFYVVTNTVCNAGKALAGEIQYAGFPPQTGSPRSVGTFIQPKYWGLDSGTENMQKARVLWMILIRHLMKIQTLLEQTSEKMVPWSVDQDDGARQQAASFIERTICDLGDRAVRQFDHLLGL